jgi:predicted metalloprotease
VRRLLILLLAAVALGGCGEEDVDRIRADARERVQQVRARAEKLRDRVQARVKEVLEEIDKAVPSAPPDAQGPRARGRTEASEIEGFLTDVIENVDRYWTRTLAASDLPEPRVSYVWIDPGDRVRTACETVADDGAAFYCPADDTIYFAQRLAAQFYDAVGDFGVAYVVAHEYAHNVQMELGRLRTDGRTSSKPFELQADCMAGLWGNSALGDGSFREADVEEAIRTAYAVGDFDYGDPNHHGTPDERRGAWLTGFESGDPNDCAQFVL